MNLSDIEKAIESINKKLEDLEARSIKIVIEPTTKLYLAGIISSVVDEQIALLPTVTYSVSSPSGVAVTGSTWYEDTGVLATRKIWVYSGSGWVQFK